MMKRHAIGLITTLVVLAVVVAVVAAVGGDTARAAGDHWEIAGNLSEACTCAVPCTCNFGEKPSPHHYCWTVISLQIEKGHYGAVKLDGLHLAMAEGQAKMIAYVDDGTSREQFEALKAIAARVLGNQNFKGDVEKARITQEIGEHGPRVQIGGKGGFEADYILGMDHKTPVVVENNTTFNVPRSAKTKTKVFRYKDAHGNVINTQATNGNQAKFDWTDQTGSYLN